MVCSPTIGPIVAIGAVLAVAGCSKPAATVDADASTTRPEARHEAVRIEAIRVEDGGIVTLTVNGRRAGILPAAIEPQDVWTPDVPSVQRLESGISAFLDMEVPGATALMRKSRVAAQYEGLLDAGQRAIRVTYFCDDPAMPPLPGGWAEWPRGGSSHGCELRLLYLVDEQRYRLEGTTMCPWPRAVDD